MLCRVGLETPGRWGRGCAETVCKLLQQGLGRALRATVGTCCSRRACGTEKEETETMLVYRLSRRTR